MRMGEVYKWSSALPPVSQTPQAQASAGSAPKPAAGLGSAFAGPKAPAKPGTAAVVPPKPQAPASPPSPTAGAPGGMLGQIFQGFAPGGMTPQGAGQLMAGLGPLTKAVGTVGGLPAIMGATDLLTTGGKRMGEIFGR